jgi:hypothetical protein
MLVRIGNVKRFSLIDAKGLGRIEWTSWGMAINSFVPSLQRVLFQLLFQAETQGKRRGSH